MKIAYFDCFSGASGDMCLGAIVDAGIQIKELKRELQKIPIRGYTLTSEKVTRSHFAAKKVSVLQKSSGLRQKSTLRTWQEIEEIIRNSSISDDVKQKGQRIFQRLFKAEAKVHGSTFHSAHLHELSAVDCIIDIFGTIIGLDMLGVERVYSSPINLGGGFVETATGILPVPAPAVAEILKKVPVYSKADQSELTTPTGAAILKGLSSGFGAIPYMNIDKIGIGAGDRNINNWPNVLRLFIGNLRDKHVMQIDSRIKRNTQQDLPDESVTVIETNIDDMNPQLFEYVMERLFKAGALDVFLIQIIMKKGRPGIQLSVLCSEQRKDALIKIIFKETTSIGLRFYETRRKVLQREIKPVDTEFGKIRVKYSKLGDRIFKASPEYEDCKKIAKQFNIPLIEVMKKVKV